MPVDAPEADRERKEQRRARWRLIVLCIIMNYSQGLETRGLIGGLKALPSSAISRSLKELENAGLIHCRDGKWFPARDVDIGISNL